jgi:hypothetical protein
MIIKVHGIFFICIWLKNCIAITKKIMQRKLIILILSVFVFYVLAQDLKLSGKKN